VDRALLLAFGRQVRQLRLDVGLSQEALADRANVHRTYLGGVERGERNVSLVNIGRIARTLGVTLPVLFDFGETSGGG